MEGKEKSKMFIGKAECKQKDTRVSSAKEVCLWEVYILYKGMVFLSLCLPNGQLCSPPNPLPSHSAPANLSQDLPLDAPGKDGFPCKGIWEERSKTFYGLASPEFWFPRSLYAQVYWHLCPKDRGMWSLDPLLRQGLVPLCSCMIALLICPQETKLGFLSLILLFLPLQGANRRLNVNS